MTDTPTAADLEQQLAQAKSAEEEARARSVAESQQRERDFRRNRLSSYDPMRHADDVRNTWATFTAELEATPVFSAFADAIAARWRQHRAANAAVDDEAFFARLDGMQASSRPRTDPPATSAAMLLDALVDLAGRRVQNEQQQADDEFANAVFGANLSPEQILQAEADAEAERRRQMAAPAQPASKPADQLTDEERAAMGLPPRNAHRTAGTRQTHLNA